MGSRGAGWERPLAHGKTQSEKQLDTPRTRKKASISGVDCVRGKLGQGTGEVESKDQMKEILLGCDKNVPFI